MIMNLVKKRIEGGRENGRHCDWVVRAIKVLNCMYSWGGMCSK